MTKLKKFGGKYKDETVDRIARYFGFSAGLHFGSDVPDEDRIKAAKRRSRSGRTGMTSCLSYSRTRKPQASSI